MFRRLGERPGCRAGAGVQNGVDHAGGERRRRMSLELSTTDIFEAPASQASLLAKSPSQQNNLACRASLMLDRGFAGEEVGEADVAPRKDDKTLLSRTDRESASTSRGSLSRSSAFLTRRDVELVARA